MIPPAAGTGCPRLAAAGWNSSPQLPVRSSAPSRRGRHRRNATRAAAGCIVTEDKMPRKRFALGRSKQRPFLRPRSHRARALASLRAASSGCGHRGRPPARRRRRRRRRRDQRLVHIAHDAGRPGARAAGPRRRRRAPALAAAGLPGARAAAVVAALAAAAADPTAPVLPAPRHAHRIPTALVAAAAGSLVPLAAAAAAGPTAAALAAAAPAAAAAAGATAKLDPELRPPDLGAHADACQCRRPYPRVSRARLELGAPPELQAAPQVPASRAPLRRSPRSLRFFARSAACCAPMMQTH
jgi:hypothetical protein